MGPRRSYDMYHDFNVSLQGGTMRLGAAYRGSVNFREQFAGTPVVILTKYDPGPETTVPASRLTVRAITSRHFVFGGSPHGGVGQIHPHAHMGGV